MSGAEGLELPSLKVPDDGKWRDRARCRGMDTALFFPSGKGRHPRGFLDEVKQCCQECPVREECLKFAMNNELPYGIYGGLTAKERKELSKSFRNGLEETV